MEYSYEDYVVTYSKNFICVKIDATYVTQIENFAKALSIAKATESHHIRDHSSEIKRFTTGLLGEAALEKLLGIKIIDWSIGDSQNYHRPDIPGYSIGIKTVERNKFPIIFKNNYYPQIICVRSNTSRVHVFVCGLATRDVLNTYQSEDLILDKALKARGTKTGFYGFGQLQQIRSLDDIREYKK